MGRRGQGGWVALAAELATKRDRAVAAGAPDVVAVVARESSSNRTVTRRLLDAFDLIAVDLDRLDIKASLGSIDAWRRLSMIDPARAAALRDDVLTGAMPLSAINDVISNVRASLSVTSAVAEMDVYAVLGVVEKQLTIPLPCTKPFGFGRTIPVDREHTVVYNAPDDDRTPLFDPHWALLISPWVACSCSVGVLPYEFHRSVVTALGWYDVVVVALSSRTEDEALMAVLADRRYKPARLRRVLLG